jgi:hypothetical protein
VHNLPWTCSWQQLKDAFVEAGVANIERADVIIDSSGRSRQAPAALAPTLEGLGGAWRCLYGSGVAMMGVHVHGHARPTYTLPSARRRWHPVDGPPRLPCLILRWFALSVRGSDIFVLAGARNRHTHRINMLS